MKLPILIFIAAGLLPSAASAQKSIVEDDGSIRIASTFDSGVTIQGPGSLCTDFNNNNGYAGNMFDIEPTANVQITAIDVNVDGVGQQVDVDVWYIPGTSFGNEDSATGWTLIGSYSGISAGADLPSFIDMTGNGVQFSAGQTYGIYADITSYSSGTAMNYTNGDLQGTTSGNDEWSNADLKIVANCGKALGHASSTFYPRNWNGCIYYDTDGLYLTMSSLQSGQQTTIATQGGAAGTVLFVGYSFAGTGPTATPFGIVDLSLPIFRLAPESVDGNGETSKSYMIPVGAAGRTIFVQALNVLGPNMGKTSNLVSGTIL
jgi:hypothetical protein